MAYDFYGVNSNLTLNNTIVSIIISALETVEPNLTSYSGKKEGKWETEPFDSNAGKRNYWL